MSEGKWVAAVKRGVRATLPAVFDRLRMAHLGVGNKSYAQEAEDLVLARFLGDATHGFYVDVGAHDPIRFSNTYLFYKRGWRGINIDAMPGSMRLFHKYRPEDVNIEMGIGLAKGVMPFYIFNEPALNTFDEALSASRNTGPYKIIKTVDVPVAPLADVLRQHTKAHDGPSFLTIDVEGRDLDALRSNDWEQFRPTFVLAECLGVNVEGALGGAVTEYLRSQRYHLVAKTFNTAFYQADER